MPVVVAVQVFYWMTNFENGVLNYLLAQLRLVDFTQHDWFETTFSQFALVTLLSSGGDPVRGDHGLRRARRRFPASSSRPPRSTAPARSASSAT